MNTAIAALVLTCATLGSGAAAHAACTLKAVTTTPAALVTYEPFSPVDNVLNVAIKVTNIGDQSCQARAYLLPANGGQTLTAGGRQMTYRMEGPSGGTGARSGELGSYAVEVGAGAERSIETRVVLPAQQILPPGLYTANLTVRMDTDAGQDIALAGANVSLQANVLARAEMSLSGVTSPGLGARFATPMINFGVAQPGQTEHIFVNVWSNSSVTIDLSSENGGVMRHAQNPSLTPIEYSTNFDGAAVSLASSVRLQRSPPMTLGGASYKLELTIGDLKSKYAGEYKDRISITVNEN